MPLVHFCRASEYSVQGCVLRMRWVGGITTDGQGLGLPECLLSDGAFLLAALQPERDRQCSLRGPRDIGCDHT